MRQVTDINRTKKTFNISVAELKKGEWLKEVPENDLVELVFKGNYLTISNCEIKKLDRTEKVKQNGN